MRFRRSRGRSRFSSRGGRFKRRGFSRRRSVRPMRIGVRM